MSAMRPECRVRDQTIRLDERELRLAVAQFPRSRGIHATADVVRLVQAEGLQVADVSVRVAAVTSPGPA